MNITSLSYAMSEKNTEPKLIEGVDYYIDDSGLLVFTGAYLLKRGFCCHQGCRHCPYKHEVPQKVPGTAFS